MPTINIGNRQDGRVKAASVIHAKGTQKSISVSIKLGLSQSFVKIAKPKKTLMGKENQHLRLLRLYKYKL